MKQSCWTILIAAIFFLVGATNRSGAFPTLQSANSAAEMTAYTETIPGTQVKFAMTPIPAGNFMMGSPVAEAGRGDDEGPQHQVTIPAFWMATMEVTWDEYDRFAFYQQLESPASTNANANAQATAADAVTQPTPPYADESFGYGKGRQPVISITHHAAMEYCRWLSQKTGKLYRLPTEAEWEYACRAGAKSAYSFGDDAKKLADYAWFTDNADGAPHPVGKKKPNAWGLYDMHGNVAEWCLDSYAKDFYSTLKANSVAPVLLPTEHRYPNSVRGGSWDDDAPRLRSAARQASKREWSKRDPQRPQSIWWHTDALHIGFRVVHPLIEQENLKGLKSKVTRQSPD
ncbi:MAG: SUMF1/EgtB/PvdO family nonheme iron enzyme [Acidobacteria bacterium]|nr:SUMF1/EgtB/PvdO family nonheme iron enzyme [Acidobacteriota bacterium]